MIDLHIHLLPGIDDGSANWEESVTMCRMAADDGCSALVATPHQRRAWPNEDPAKLSALLAELTERSGGAPQLHQGGEIHIDSELLDELARDDLAGLCPLAGTHWLLLEFDQMPPAMGTEAIIHEVVLAGWKPIIAHPEFIPFLAGDLALLGQLVHLGARAQITAMSVTGDFGKPPQELALTMIHERLIHFVGSDAHTPEWRPPGLAAARDAIERRWGATTAARLTAENPRLVIEDGAVPIDPLA
jgi:protein-tyrosine phosphatase